MDNVFVRFRCVYLCAWSVGFSNAVCTLRNLANKDTTANICSMDLSKVSFTLVTKCRRAGRQSVAGRQIIAMWGTIFVRRQIVASVEEP